MYSIYSIIIFLKNQRDRNYSSIEKMLEIIDDEHTDDTDKREIILGVLRDAGLYEVDYEEEIPEEVQDAIQKEYEKRMARATQNEKPPQFAVQIFVLRLLNYNIQVGVILN